MTVLLRLGFTLAVAAIWVFVTAHGYASIKTIWTRDIDARATVRVVWQQVTRNPFTFLLDLLLQRAEVKFSFAALDGYTLTPRAGDAITSEFIRDRKQYLLTLTNPSNTDISRVMLRFQMPYPVEQLADPVATWANGFQVRQPDNQWQVNAVGDGAGVFFHRTPMSPNFEISITELKGPGDARVYVVLNVSRGTVDEITSGPEKETDARGQLDPLMYYVYGRYVVRGESKELYAPILLRDSNTVVTGPSSDHPPVPAERLGRSSGMF